MLAWIPAALIRPDVTLSGATHGITRTGLTNGWLGDYLRDPGGALLALLAHLRDWVITWGPIATPVLALAVAGFVIGRRQWARRCHAELLAYARQVTVLDTPTVGTPARDHLS